MEYLIGLILALAVSVFASIVGFDRDRVFYPALLAIIATYYALFAVMGGSSRALFIESAIILVFLLAAVIGYKLNLWLIVCGLFAHGVFDFAHAHIIANKGVPLWWPGFCMAYDVTAAAALAWLLCRSRRAARVVDNSYKYKYRPLPSQH
ncbi:MAG TPA: hypothetical protein VMZ27_05810 [Candidatus Saccharimonadales bacterium]|nr:hypothetical protein [Candidatus Saccharimonadales bacterium]